MKILFLDQFSDVGGAQQGLLMLLPAMRERGWHAMVAAPGDGEMIHRARREGADVQPLPLSGYGSGEKSPADLLRFARDLPRVGLAVQRMIKRFRPDLLYVNGPRVLPAAALACPANLPVLFHAHSYLGKAYATRLAGLALRRMHALVVGCCDFVADPWKAFLPAHRVGTVYNGVPEIGFRERRLSRSMTIGIVGRIAPEKGHLLFVEAARRLAAEFPELQFEVAGEALFGDRAADAYAASVRKAAAGLPIVFTGWRHRVADAFERLDLLVVPSMAHEATTRVIPEAWSAGVPVVASSAGGIAEIVTDNVTGFLMRGMSAEALASRVRDVLYAAPGILREVVENARKKFEQRFTIEQYQAGMLEACRRLQPGQ